MKTVSRTVQYWRLVEGPTGKTLPESDWEMFLRRLVGTPKEHTVGGEELNGRAYQLSVTEHWEQALSVSDIEDAKNPGDSSITYGIVIASRKDFVPSQQNASSGDQRALERAGKDWFPVDNLFVWFLPFGNIVGMLAESNSSTRAGKFVDWLTKETQAQTGNHDFSWGVEPVIDGERAKLLKRASGLRSFNVAGTIGSAVVASNGLETLFGSKAEGTRAIKVEVKASFVQGLSNPNDEVELLKWFNTQFGNLDGAISKAQVTVAGDMNVDRTEIDLLRQRLTRKTNVSLASDNMSSITALSAVGAIISAFVKDREDLLKLRFLPE